MLFDVFCLMVIVVVVGAGWHHIITEIREDDRRRAIYRASAKAMGASDADL